jgi:hypothetical protein
MNSTTKRALVLLAIPPVTIYVCCAMILNGLGVLSGYFYLVYGEADKKLVDNMESVFNIYDKLFNWAKEKKSDDLG